MTSSPDAAGPTVDREGAPAHDVVTSPARDAAAAVTTSEHQPPLAMQIALRVEKTALPDELEACAAAAQACVGLLVEAERRASAGVATSGDTARPGTSMPDASMPDTSMLDAVDAWRGVAIRKIVRRCSGKRWSDAQALDGVTARHGGAEARAFVPAPTSPLPPELKKMQVEGTQLPAGDAMPEGAFVTVRISPLVTMTSGKSAAQCAHAAQRAWEAMTDAERRRWADDDHRVRIVRDTEANWVHASGRVSIVDAGFTELDGEHETTRADW